ncbi:Dam family site-specific DNA-(adenine-N6)-methyltransferase [Synechococcus sp. PCC 7336]|uniref:DNA adenine methylase n=1 Tax=Synechococcus sp. PCC 7336 TaxID=195250 RepID=UPI00034CA885|nr:Dam family site-specific DNA-(adenine-N6)-methyltransferase [Synechococcus sp. PCC 7336]
MPLNSVARTASSAKPIAEPALKPPLKWAGGKRWLVPQLLELWQPYRDRRLLEPFVGGMAIALGLRPERAILNDTNEHLINFYRWLQRGLQIERELSNNKELYYQYRTEFNQLVEAGRADSCEAAELFYYLNRTGFNGLCRFNRNNQFNVPFGRYKTINYQRNFQPYRPLFETWTIRHGDFDTVPRQADDFIYADPPYDVEFTTYSAKGFDWLEQVRLAEWLARHEGPVVASNQATERICRLYRSLGFTVDTLPGPRRISCTGDRTPALEILATKGF